MFLNQGGGGEAGEFGIKRHSYSLIIPKPFLPVQGSQSPVSSGLLMLPLGCLDVFVWNSVVRVRE